MNLQCSNTGMPDEMIDGCDVGSIDCEAMAVCTPRSGRLASYAYFSAKDDIPATSILSLSLTSNALNK